MGGLFPSVTKGVELETYLFRVTLNFSRSRKGLTAKALCHFT